MTNSPNLGLPFISASQTQKHVTHNEAIAMLDTLVQLAVESANVATPPESDVEGTRYIVPEGATDTWAGHASRIAQKEIGGWRFVAPSPGSRAWIKDDAALAVFDGAGWVDYRTLMQDLSVSKIGVGATADDTNRLAVSAPASLFNHAGTNHRMALNKQAAADTASLVFQNDFSGRAEFGLAGSDDFSIKVSPDGSDWHQALISDRNSGAIRAPAGLTAPGLPLRVATAVLTTAFSTTTTAPQQTGLLVTLTPRSTTSKMLVRGHLTLGGNFWNSSPDISVARNGTKVWPSVAAAMSHRVISGTLSNSRIHTLPATFEFLDAPATDAPVTYEVLLGSSVSGSSAHLNVRDIDLLVRGESSLVVTEISG